MLLERILMSYFIQLLQCHLSFVFSGLEQLTHLFMPLIWQLLEGHWIKDIINGKEECSKTSASKVCVFNSTAVLSLILEIESKLILWVSL